MTNADKLAARAKQEADNYIKQHWGSMAFENLAFDAGLHDHWLEYHDAYIDTHANEESTNV